MTNPDISFKDATAGFIAAHRLLDSEAGPVLVGLSGGADSVALLSVLVELGYEVIAVHCNFHLRGEESDRDMAHALSVAGELGAECLVEHFDISAWRGKHGGSVEMACRQTRYDAFRRIMEERSAQAVAVAHHSEDNLETVLHNLMRGTGIAGLTGMDPRRDDIVRPLLFATRAMIEHYLEEKSLGYMDDSSNIGNDYARNRIRNIVVPAMVQAFPNAINGVLSTAGMLRETEAFYRRAVETGMKPYLTDDGIDLRSLAEDSSGSLLLFEYLRPRGVSRSMADDMLASGACSGRKFESSGNVWINDHGFLRQQNAPGTVPVAFPFIIEQIAPGELVPVRDNSVAYLDAAAESAGLAWRYWQEGDRIAPYGMKGTKKVSDLFRDARIPVDRKQTIPMLTDADGNILFIPGVRASRLYPVTPATVRVLRVKLI